MLNIKVKGITRFKGEEIKIFIHSKIQFFNKKEGIIGRIFTVERKRYNCFILFGTRKYFKEIRYE